MADYLSTGGIKAPDILVNAPRREVAPASRDELYLEGYGRQFGEKMTYSVGLTYGMGLLAGGSYGALLGVRQGGATSKLFVNSVLNSCSRYGPTLGNQSAIITMYYVSFHSLISYFRGSDDIGNALSAGAFAGALYKVAARSWQPVGKYAVASMGIFTGLDTLMRGGYM
uniref:Mitochondrial import inner membrane translocase subunit tim23 n=1 Tax=Strombidinopsis acuminata TaxID=141414 RepID=A0A7S3TRN0_9SPIT|mmetsp:Transcript_67326/g.173347  ORF Transcript_67326/g.173347 Transcript_67326/m.173347 type:complete len:169 (-) Transcript_67326:93-599(-)